MTLRQRVNTGFALAILLLVGIGIAAYLSAERQRRTADLVRRTERVLALIYTLSNDIHQAETAQRGFVITGSEAFLQPYDRAVAQMGAVVDSLRVLTGDNPSQVARVRLVEELLEGKRAHMRAVIRARRTEGFGPAAALIQTGRGQVLTDRLRTVLGRMRQEEVSLLEIRAGESRDTADRTLLILLLGTFVTVVVIGSAIYRINRELRGRERSERALRVEQAYLEQLVQTAPEAIAMIDLDGHVLRINPEFTRLFGYGVGDAVGRNLSELVAPADRIGESRELMRSVIERGERVNVETIRRRRDGAPVHVSLLAAPIDVDDQRLALYAIYRDIGDRVEGERALRAAKEAAERANAAKSDFLARMSHELRTPLNSVIGFANVLRRNKSGKLAAQELDFIDRILANGKHLLALINDILDLSKVEAGKIELAIETVDLTSFLRQVAAEFEGQTHGRDVELRVEVPERPVTVRTDPDRLRQVLANLIANAVKFTDRGTVTVRLKCEAGEPIAIQVIDTGIGIPRDRLEAIFDAFEQAERTTTRRFGGTGLGLAISRSVTELLGFRLRVESEPGVGSTFTIDLQPGIMAAAAAERAPADRAEAPAARASAVEARELQRPLILVIDDDPDARVLLREHLQELDCGVATARTGEEGLALARELRPDLITLDLMLPGMAGWDVLRELKQEPTLAETPVVVLSVVAGESRDRVTGAVAILDKPVSRESLRRAVVGVLAPARCRVLVVDDDADARTLIRHHLEELGVRQITCASSGGEALERLEDGTFDLVLLDLIMPEMDGLTLFERLRARPEWRELPVVVVSAKVLEPEERARLEGRIAGFLPKGEGLQEDLRRVLHHILAAGPEHG